MPWSHQIGQTDERRERDEPRAIRAGRVPRDRGGDREADDQRRHARRRRARSTRSRASGSTPAHRLGARTSADARRSPPWRRARSARLRHSRRATNQTRPTPERDLREQDEGPGRAPRRPAQAGPDRERDEQVDVAVQELEQDRRERDEEQRRPTAGQQPQRGEAQREVDGDQLLPREPRRRVEQPGDHGRVAERPDRARAICSPGPYRSARLIVHQARASIHRSSRGIQKQDEGQR